MLSPVLVSTVAAMSREAQSAMNAKSQAQRMAVLKDLLEITETRKGSSALSALAGLLSPGSKNAAVPRRQGSKTL
jgi:hypothetical protein